MQSIQPGIVVEVPDLAASNKKSAIRVLHVDDDSSALDISKQIMMDIDTSLEFDSANSVDEAFKKLSSGQQFDVVISDYEMPQKNGLQFLKELREQKNEIPFILFTGKGREEVAIDALNLGANRYINKNGDPETVYTELASSVTQAVEHLRTQSLLQQSEERFSLLSGATFEGIGFSEEGKIVDANNQLEKMVGYSHSELLGLKVVDLLAPESRDFVESRLKSGPEGPYECLLVKKDDSVLPVEIRAKNIYRKGKRERVCAIRDLSENKTAERSLEESERKYKNLFENSPDVVVTIDLAGKVTSANKAIMQHGFRENEIVGKSVLEFVPMEFNQKMFSSLKNISKGKPCSRRNRNANSQRKAKCRVPYNPIWLNGKVVGYQTVLRDVTERKKAEDALRQEHNMIESVAAASGAGLAIVGKDYRVQWANEFIKRYKGDTVGKLCYATLNSLESPCPDCGVAKVLAGKTLLDSHEYCATTVDGNPYWVEIVATPLTDEDGNIISGGDCRRHNRTQERRGQTP